MADGLLIGAMPFRGAVVRIVQEDTTIDGADRDVKLFVRSKRANGTQPTGDNIVVFVHGATFPSAPLSPDTWSYPEDRDGLMHELTNAPSKRSVTIKNAHALRALREAPL